eukprot:7240868-Heterocapsa_arctica.AAC.1
MNTHQDHPILILRTATYVVTGANLRRSMTRRSNSSTMRNTSQVTRATQETQPNCIYLRLQPFSR